MGKLQEFLMTNEENAQATAEVAVSGFPVPFTIKSITEGENKALRKSCQKVTFDKKTHQKTTDTIRTFTITAWLSLAPSTPTSRTQTFRRSMASWAPKR